MSEERSLPIKMADLCHQQWAGWMEYLFQHGRYNENGTFTISADEVTRWRRQMRTCFSKLSEGEQQSDLNEASKFHALVYEHFEASMTHIETAYLRTATYTQIYREVGLDGVANALETIAWSIISTVRTMLFDWKHCDPDARR